MTSHHLFELIFTPHHLPLHQTEKIFNETVLWPLFVNPDFKNFFNIVFPEILQHPSFFCKTRVKRVRFLKYSFEEKAATVFGDPLAITQHLKRNAQRFWYMIVEVVRI